MKVSALQYSASAWSAEGTYKILTEHREFYRRTQNIDITVESVLELNRQRALDLGIEESKISDNIAEVVSNPNVDIVVEVIGGVEPARALSSRRCTAARRSSPPIRNSSGKYWYELEKAARRTNAGLYFEASCVGGVPIIRTLIDGMQANVVHTLTGIINGTTNYILTRMTREGLDYASVLKDAQALGYAEKDPRQTSRDSMRPISSPSSPASHFHTKVPLDKVYREGITGISSKDIAYGEELGYVLKLLADRQKTTEQGASRCACIPHSSAEITRSPSVNDSFNAVFLQGDSVGRHHALRPRCRFAPDGQRDRLGHYLCGDPCRSQVRDFKNTQLAEKGVRYVTDFQSRTLR